MSDARPCPRCIATPLLAGEARGVHLHACGQCGGVWLGPDEAARILRPLFTPGGLPGRPSRLRCPHCSQGMTEWTVGTTGVQLDSCAAHGTWFDRDEVEALAAAAAEMRDRPAPEFAGSRAARLAPAAIAGAAAAIAAQAVAHADILHATDQLPPEQRDNLVDNVLDVASASPDLTGAVVETTAHVAVEATATAAEVGVEVAGSALELAGGFLEAIGEFIAGLFS